MLYDIIPIRAEEAFSKALQCDTIELSISRSHSFLSDNQSNRVSSVNGTSSQGDVNDNVDGITDEDKNTVPPLPNFSSPTYKKPLGTQDKNDVAIPRIVEKKIVIDLQKGSDGLGFSVTSRDNPAGGACPIYVKNILPHGAAIRDGQLQAGDQILEVDGTEMTGKSQGQAVDILRSTKGQVKLLIQRKVTITSPIGSTKLIKDLERAPSDSRGNKILTYQIPLPISGTAGLGITVKGKSNISEQNESSGDDLGIFVKTVVPGGAAHQDGRLRPNDQLISVNGVKLTGMSNSSAMKTLRSAMETKTSGPVEVTVIRSVKEIMNNVSELETIRKQKNTSDRAIDIGGSGSERIDVPDGALGDIKEIESNDSKRKQNQQGTKITDEDTRSKPDELKPSHYHIRPASDDELRRGTKLNEISHDNRHQTTQRRAVSDDELKHRPTNRREQNDEMKKLFAKPVLSKNNMDVSSNRVLNGHNNVNKVQDKAEKSRLNINTTQEDKVPELKPSRVRQTKTGNGIHRNPSYYIAMNRTGQRAERLPKSKKPKSPFYQPKDESHDKDKEPNMSRATKEEKPQIVIASITDTARVWNTTRPMSITNRPSSTVAEPTSALSTSASATLPRSSDQSRASLSPPRESKRPPTSINIPKGIPPPPPPRTQRPSPYTKQFPNYLLAMEQSARKSDSTFYSDNSDVSPAFQNPKESLPRESSAKVVSAMEVKSESKNDEKPNISAQNESKVDDVIDYLTDDEEDGTGEHFVREGMGRQSMSEKRFKLAQADITQTEFYKQRVTRSKSLEGAIAKEHNVNQGQGTYLTKTLPRPSTTPIEKSRRRKSDEEYNERLIDFAVPIPKERSKKSDKESLMLGHFDPNNVRGQWRTSSDGVVKKYGRHGNYIKASPLASMANNNFESVHIDNGGDDAIPITMQSNADYSSVHPKVKKKSSGFNLKNLGAALKPKAYKGKYDMQSRQTPESPSEPAVDIDEQRYRQLVLGKPRERSLSETLYTRYDVAMNDSPGRSRRKKQEQQKRPSPSLQDILRKGSGEYSITESAQI
ncbi:partitioning defective 3 homolog isoform X1 [Paramuricea clavata]|uniref:Partitioning defective 3 homolog isoform X1 n=1 Tax=Paramuricea clavata TaxID=317549 RepID=A0A6S7FI91_PARCT|nr:partitioning defective 3 homolog isoform X1 [Paramuricea clavata]